MSNPDIGRQFLQAIISRQLDNGEAGTFDALVLGSLQNIKGTRGKLTCSMMIVPQLQNRYGTMHGGCMATVVDTVGTAALCTVSAKAGVSLSISIDYFSPQPGMEEVSISAQVVKVGKTIATIAVELHNKKTGRLVASGRHMKFLSDDQGQSATADIPRSKL